MKFLHIGRNAQKKFIEPLYHMLDNPKMVYEIITFLAKKESCHSDAVKHLNIQELIFHVHYHFCKELFFFSSVYLCNGIFMHWDTAVFIITELNNYSIVNNI